MTNLELAFKYEDEGKPAEAERLYLTMLAECPSNGTLLHNLGRLYQRYGITDKSVEAFKRLLAVEPSNAEARKALANLFLDCGLTAEAVEQFKRLSNPSETLFAVCHSDNAKLCQIMHNEWGIQFQTSARHTANNKRIGYLSPNFRAHTVPKFFIPVLTAQDYCYSDVAKPDAVTAEIRERCANWRDSSNWSDARLAAELDKDGIDVVVDLTGHLNGGRRMPLFGRLPVSYSYIGYPRGTGLRQQIRITDSVIDPTDSTAEKLVRVDGGCYAYQGDGLEPSAKPVGERVVYGSLNRPCKFSDGLLRAWAAILSGSNSVLRLLVPGGENSVALRLRVQAAGVPADRLQLIPTGGHYQEFIRSLDIVLDSFAYSGMTTTCDALWAGVPVVTLAGNTPQSRVGASVLTAANLTGGIASTEAEYVAKAIEGCALRGTALREHLKASNLCNGSIASRLRAAITTVPVKDCGCGKRAEGKRQ